jgi:polyisoprenyl-phosphate glycosyltransferase
VHASDHSDARAADQSPPPLLSVVVPVFCEEPVLEEFYRRAKGVMDALAPRLRHELIFVNDGSTDGSLRIVTDLARRDPTVRVLDLSRNFGHQAAITAGVDHARGDAVVTIDGDLQDPPELIPQMVEMWEQGCRVVYAVRRRRAGEPRLRLAMIRMFYRLLDRLSDLRIPPDSGDFRLMDRRTVNVLTQLREPDRYLRGLATWAGFRQCPLYYERDPRYAGETKYPFAKLVKLGLDGISSFSDKPLRFSSHLGFVVTVGALLFMGWVIVGKLLYPERVATGWASVMVVVLFLGGVQLLCIGILGEYVGRVFRQGKGRPLYVVDERYNFDAEVPAPAATPANVRGSAIPATADGGGSATREPA